MSETKVKYKEPRRKHTYTITEFAGIIHKKKFLPCLRFTSKGIRILTKENLPKLGEIVVEQPACIILGRGLCAKFPTKIYKKGEYEEVTTITTYSI